jgi:hypothetical protein
LLLEFFRSSAICLDRGGDIMVALCKGQSGLPCDKSRKAYKNSWQISTQAAESKFVLCKVHNFDEIELEGNFHISYQPMIICSLWKCASLTRSLPMKSYLANGQCLSLPMTSFLAEVRWYKTYFS